MGRKEATAVNLFQLEVLVKVVDTENFTKAGEILGLTQSGVSHTISALEAELGISLLNRGRNGVTLTDAGERMIGHMRNILMDSQHLKQISAAIQGMEQGTIRIGSFPSVSAKLLPKILSQFTRLYPAISLELEEGGYQDITQWVNQGTVDVGFVSLPVTGLEVIPLLRDPLMVVLPARHPLGQEPFVDLKQVVNELFIMPKSGCEALVRATFRSAGCAPHVLFEVEDNQTIISMVEEGLGYTIVPRLTLPPAINGATIVELRPVTHRQIGLAVKSLKDSTPAVRKFIEVASSLVKQLFPNQ